MVEPSQRFRVGYALESKKIQSLIRPSLIDLAKERGIDLILITKSDPLVEQGPFDCVIHKLYGQDWSSQLHDFASKYPHTHIIDHPDPISKLTNRVSMLDAVSYLEHKWFGIPIQLVFHGTDNEFDDALNVVKFPMISKPLASHGSLKSHEMSVILNREGLNNLTPPVLLQKFVNHGGVIFKVYVLGEYVQCVKRKSLPDISDETLSGSEGSISLPRVSNLPTHNMNCVALLDQVELPPESLINEIASGLRRQTGLNLFNFDVILDTSAGNRYLVIDINYFPGYDKLPCYELLLTDFLCDVMNGKQMCVEIGGSSENNADVVDS